MPPASAGEIVPPAAVADGLDVSLDVGVEACEEVREEVDEEVDGVSMFVGAAGVVIADVAGIGSVSVIVDVTAVSPPYMVVVLIIVCCCWV